MASITDTYYAFNANIISKTVTYKTTSSFTFTPVTKDDQGEWSVLGTPFTIKVVGAKDNIARLNISPILQSLFTEVSSSNQEIEPKCIKIDTNYYLVKYGYKNIGESEWDESITTQNNSLTLTDDSVRVRFLDHFGNTQYWKFSKGAVTHNASSNGETLYMIQDGETYGRPQIKVNSTAITLFHPLATEEEFNFLSDILKSIQVSILVTVKQGRNQVTKALPVIVTSGSASWERDIKNTKLQDFEVQIQTIENTISL